MPATVIFKLGNTRDGSSSEEAGASEFVQELGSGFCSARLQAGMRLTPKCPPEGGRYINEPILNSHTDSLAPASQLAWSGASDTEASGPKGRIHATSNVRPKGRTSCKTSSRLQLREFSKCDRSRLKLIVDRAKCSARRGLIHVQDVKQLRIHHVKHQFPCRAWCRSQWENHCPTKASRR